MVKSINYLTFRVHVKLYINELRPSAVFGSLQLLSLRGCGGGGGGAAHGLDAGVHPDSNFASLGPNFKKIRQEMPKLSFRSPM